MPQMPVSRVSGMKITVSTVKTFMISLVRALTVAKYSCTAASRSRSMPLA